MPGTTPSLSRTPRIALVYDRVNTPYGGAENVLQALHQAYPEAPLFTSLYDPTLATWAKDFNVIPVSFFSSVRFIQKHHRWLAPFMPVLFESHDFSRYDIVISITSAEAKGVLTLPHQLHLCYLLTPPRYLYSHSTHHQHKAKKIPIIGLFSSAMFKYLRWWDQAAQARPDNYLPISKLVAARARQFYPQASILPALYPPVTVPKKLPAQIDFSLLAKSVGFPPSIQPHSFALLITRLVSYKHIDLSIEACIQTNTPVVIVGTGPEEKYLHNLYQGHPLVCFLGIKSRQVVEKLLLTCLVVLTPSEEDFGITTLEALSFGKPVITHQKSGASELLSFPEHGQALFENTSAAIAQALVTIKQTHFDPLKLHKVVQQYSTDNFLQKFTVQVKTLWKEYYDKR